jgi:hypothetical protein
MEAGARSHLKIITAASLARITLEEILRALTGGTYPWAACCATTTRPAERRTNFRTVRAAVGKTIVSSGLIDRVVERRAYHIGELAIGRQVAGLSPKGRKD